MKQPSLSAVFFVAIFVALACVCALCAEEPLHPYQHYRSPNELPADELKAMYDKPVNKEPSVGKLDFRKVHKLKNGILVEDDRWQSPLSANMPTPAPEDKTTVTKIKTIQSVLTTQDQIDALRKRVELLELKLLEKR
jgi:hypothetical protein